MNIVTISRLVGSYGDIIAATVARKLGLELLGRDQVHELAESCDPEFRDACTAYENEHGPGFFERIFFDSPSYTSLFQALTYEAASRGKVVLVGRGAQIVLRDVPGVLKVRVVAPPDVRTKRIMERYNFTRDEAEDFVRSYDHKRETLIRSIFHSDSNDWALYDIIINTAHFTSGAASEVVLDALANLHRPADVEAVTENLRNLAVAKRIETIIRKKLTSSAAGNVLVDMEPTGVVTLSGKILDKQGKMKAEKMASDYPGVAEVVNDLKVTELSFHY